MKVSHVHCRVRDLQAAARWFEQVLHVVPVVHNERMAWLGFGEFGVLLDAAPSPIAAGQDWPRPPRCDHNPRWDSPSPSTPPNLPSPHRLWAVRRNHGIWTRGHMWGLAR